MRARAPEFSSVCCAASALLLRTAGTRSRSSRRAPLLLMPDRRARRSGCARCRESRPSALTPAPGRAPPTRETATEVASSSAFRRARRASSFARAAPVALCYLPGDGPDSHLAPKAAARPERYCPPERVEGEAADQTKRNATDVVFRSGHDAEFTNLLAPLVKPPCQEVLLSESVFGHRVIHDG